MSHSVISYDLVVFLIKTMRFMAALKQRAVYMLKWKQAMRFTMPTLWRACVASAVEVSDSLLWVIHKRSTQCKDKFAQRLHSSWFPIFLCIPQILPIMSEGIIRMVSYFCFHVKNISHTIFRSKSIKSLWYSVEVWDRLHTGFDYRLTPTPEGSWKEKVM